MQGGDFRTRIPGSLDTRGTKYNWGKLQFKLRKCVDPRIDVDDLANMDREYIGYVGAQHWDPKSIVAETYNDNDIKFTHIPKYANGTMWDMNWMVEYRVKVSIKDIPIIQGDKYPFTSTKPEFTFRPYPLSQCTSTISLKLNGREIQSYPMDYLNPRMEYWPQDKLKLSLGCCPHRKFNGQTMADCRIRGGNSPMTSMEEFTDSDYPNSTLTTIHEVKYDYDKYKVIDDYSNFDLAHAPPEGYKLAVATTKAKIAAGSKYKDGNGALDNDYKQNILFLCYLYSLCRAEFIKYVKSLTEEGEKITINLADRLTVRENFLTSHEFMFKLDTAEVNCSITKVVTDLMLQYTSSGLKNDIEATSTPAYEIGEDLDVTIMPVELRSAFKNWLPKAGVPNNDMGKTRAIVTHQINDNGEYEPTEYFYGTSVGSCTYTLDATIREPVICEPLDFTSSNNFGRTMWNIESAELCYLIKGGLRNMLAFDEYALSKKNWYWLYVIAGGNKFLNNKHIDVAITETPKLHFNVATPFRSPACPFVCAHKQFERKESYAADASALAIRSVSSTSSNDLKTYINPNECPKITVTSPSYNLTFHPNSIFIWVGQRSTDRYSEDYRYTKLDSFAKITNINITYGNCSNILAKFDEHELYQMSLRNGLQDRTYLDWQATPKSIVVPTDYYGMAKLDSGFGNSQEYIETIKGGVPTLSGVYQTGETMAENRYAGVGSVIRLIPGIDILTGDATQPLIAGANAFSQGIEFKVEFIPLNVYEPVNYSLFVMFEHDGICTMHMNTCDLGMIAIDSWASLKTSPKARTIREVPAYGAGLKGGCMRAARLTDTVGKGWGLHKGGSINANGNLGASYNQRPSYGGALIGGNDKRMEQDFFTTY